MASGRESTPSEEQPEGDWWIDESWPGPTEEGLTWEQYFTSSKSSVGVSSGNVGIYYTDISVNSGNNITWAIDPTR